MSSKCLFLTVLLSLVSPVMAQAQTVDEVLNRVTAALDAHGMKLEIEAEVLSQANFNAWLQQFEKGLLPALIERAETYPKIKVNRYSLLRYHEPYSDGSLSLPYDLNLYCLAEVVKGLDAVSQMEKTVQKKIVFEIPTPKYADYSDRAQRCDGDVVDALKAISGLTAYTDSFKRLSPLVKEMDVSARAAYDYDTVNFRGNRIEKFSAIATLELDGYRPDEDLKKVNQLIAAMDQVHEALILFQKWNVTSEFAFLRKQQPYSTSGFHLDQAEKVVDALKRAKKAVSLAVQFDPTAKLDLSMRQSLNWASYTQRIDRNDEYDVNTDETVTKTSTSASVDLGLETPDSEVDKLFSILNLSRELSDFLGLKLLITKNDYGMDTTEYQSYALNTEYFNRVNRFRDLILAKKSAFNSIIESSNSVVIQKRLFVSGAVAAGEDKKLESLLKSLP